MRHAVSDTLGDTTSFAISIRSSDLGKARSCRLRLRSHIGKTGPLEDEEGGTFKFNWTLADILNPLSSSGFILRRILESPAEDSRFRQDYSYLLGTDSLLDWSENPGQHCQHGSFTEFSDPSLSDEAVARILVEQEGWDDAATLHFRVRGARRIIEADRDKDALMAAPPRCWIALAPSSPALTFIARPTARPPETSPCPPTTSRRRNGSRRHWPRTRASGRPPTLTRAAVRSE